MTTLEKLLTVDNLFNAGMILASVVSLAWWILAIRRGGSFLGGCVELVPTEPRIRPFWTPLDIVLFLLGQLLIIQSLVSLWAYYGLFDFGSQSPEFNVPMDRMSIRIATVQSGLISVIVFLTVMRMRGPVFAAVGLQSRWSDIWLGLKWSLLLIPGTLWISTLAEQLVPYEHEVIDAVTITTAPLELAILFISTAVLTPFLEEFLYRGLVQGSMEHISALYRSTLRRDKADVSQKKKKSKPADAADNPPESIATVHSASWRPQSLWPILLSSVIFAALHFGQGAAPIPLFFLRWVSVGCTTRPVGCGRPLSCILF